MAPSARSELKSTLNTVRVTDVAVQENSEIAARGETDAIEDDRQAAGGHRGGSQGWWQ